MVYFAITYPSISLLGGVCFVMFIRKLALWFARNLHRETITKLFLPSTSGRLLLRRLRMSRILYIIIAILLFIMVGIPGLLGHIPSYFVIITIMLPLTVGCILTRVASMLVRRQISSSKLDEKSKPICLLI